MRSHDRLLRGRLGVLLIVGLATWVGAAGSAPGGTRAIESLPDFTWAPTSPEIGEVVSFEITGVAAGDIERAEWELGGLGCDGSTSVVCEPGIVFCDTAAFRYASGGSKTVTLTVTVGGVPQPPVVHSVSVQASGSCFGAGGAFLTFEPAAPEIGGMVVFTVNGFAGPVRTVWDFGDAGCAGFPQYQTCDPIVTFCQQMGFAFASAGGAHVAVVIEDPGTGAVLDTASAEVSVAPSGSCGTGAGELYVLQSFSAPGVAGSVWRHEMELVNPEALDVILRLDWLPRGVDNTVPPLTAFVGVPAGSGVRFDNVLDEVFGLTSDVGSLRLSGFGENLLVSNLGLNTTTTGASAGGVIPTAGPSDGLAAGEVGTIFHLGQTADLRTNIGCNNLSGVAVPVSLELADTSGTVLDTLAVLVQPFSDHQRGNVFQDFVPVEGSVRVSHSHPDGVITCVGMVVYDVSADFRSESMHELTGSGVTVVVPRAVHQAGATTDLALLAPAGPAEARIDFLPTGQDNTTFVSTNVALADRQEIRLPAILDSVFSATGTGALRVVATSGSVLTSAVERRGPAGAETHRRARVEPLDNQVPAFHPVALIHLTEGPVHRTDLGVVNTSGLTVDVAVDLHDASGARLGTRSFELLPYSHAELQGVFASVGHPVVADGLARVSTTTSGGAFFAYAIVTELVTQDSWEMSAQALPTALFADGFETGDTARWSSSFPP